MSQKSKKTLVNVPELKALVNMLPDFQWCTECVVHGALEVGKPVEVSLYNDRRPSPVVNGTTVTLPVLHGYVAINSHQFVFTDKFILKVIPEVV